jgi:hypothetical protein
MAVTLEDVHLREMGGQAFVVGREAKASHYTRTNFPGSIHWIPLKDVKRLVELSDEVHPPKPPDEARPPKPPVDKTP